MDFNGEPEFSGGDVGMTPPPDISGGGSGLDSWGSGVFSDPAIWATEDDYRAWSSEPPNKKSRNSSDSHVIVTNRSKAIGKMFYKTKLCCKFRAGVCPYITNCNFAHGMEELRRPPPNWQEIVAAHGGSSMEPREEHQIPTISSPELRGEPQRSYKGRHCKKFYTEEGCPYGDSCSFLHDEQSRARESVAISVTPTVGSSFAVNGNGTNLKPSNWKTRICNKWETTGYCPFGNKCHFAHGSTELHKFGGGAMEGERDPSSSTPPPEPKQAGAPTKTTADNVVASADSYHHSSHGVTGIRPTVVAQRPNQRPHQKWKGPDKISKIYGDWIDDIE